MRAKSKHSAKDYPTEAAIERACKAAAKVGMKVVRFRVEPGGAIDVWDVAALPREPVPALTAYEKRQARKAGT